MGTYIIFYASFSKPRRDHTFYVRNETVKGSLNIYWNVQICSWLGTISYQGQNCLIGNQLGLHNALGQCRN